MSLMPANLSRWTLVAAGAALIVMAERERLEQVVLSRGRS